MGVPIWIRAPYHPLRTLDALHLAVAVHAEVDAIATTDTVMATAADEIGRALMRF